MHVSSDVIVGMQRYFYRHTYNTDNIPNCRYAIPTWKVSFQEIPSTDVCVTILLYLIQNTCTYLHGRYIFKKYLLMYVSLSCCIWYKIPAHTFICICLYLSVYLLKIHSHTCRSCRQGCSCFYSKSTRPSGLVLASLRGLGFRRCCRPLGSPAATPSSSSSSSPIMP
jgi:hypothetical protein